MRFVVAAISGLVRQATHADVVDQFAGQATEGSP
jgi:hypothetical protein